MGDITRLKMEEQKKRVVPPTYTTMMSLERSDPAAQIGYSKETIKEGATETDTQIREGENIKEEGKAPPVAMISLPIIK